MTGRNFFTVHDGNQNKFIDSLVYGSLIFCEGANVKILECDGSSKKMNRATSVIDELKSSGRTCKISHKFPPKSMGTIKDN